MDSSVHFLHAEKSYYKVVKDFICDLIKAEDAFSKIPNNQHDDVAQMICDGADIGAWAFNLVTKEFYFTEKWATTLGYDENDYQMLTMDKILSLVHPSDLPLVHQALEEQANGTRDNCNCFLRMKSKQGQWVGVLVRGKTIFENSEHIPTWMFGINLDLTEFIQSKIKYKDFAEKTQKLYKTIPGFLYQLVMNQDGTHYFSFLSENIKEIYGYTAEECMAEPEKLWKIIHPSDILRVQKTTIDSAKNMSLWSQRFRIIHPTKGIRWVEAQSTPKRNSDESIVWSGYIHDDTDFQKSKDLSRIATSVYNHSQEGIIVANKFGKIEKVNPSFSKIIGLNEEEFIFQNLKYIFDEFIYQGFFDEIHPILLEHKTWQGEVLLKNKDDEFLNVLLSIDLVKDEDFNMICNYIAIFTDISQIKRNEDDLKHFANFDFLTGLPNRRLLLEKLDKALIHAKEKNHKTAICFIDLDKFKPINDKYGHAIGDGFLCAISSALLESIRSHDTVARLGGDEFVIILSDIDDHNEMETMLERISNTCSQTYCINNINLATSASIGVVIYPNVEGTADELLRFADQSMYKAKQQGRKRFVYFDQKQEEASISHYKKIEALKKALINGEMSLWYQPKLGTNTNTIMGVEALIRWNTSDGDIIPAKDFINTILGDHMDIVLGNFVLDKALKEQKRWADKNIDITVSVNISPDHLLCPTFKDELSALIKKHNVNPHNLMIEILETSKISDFDAVVERLQECIELGVSFSLDDFGTGYSSLGYLRSLPVQEVKIDKSFIQTILEKKEDKMIVQGIIDLAHGLDRKVLAEGVESAEHIEVLNAMGIDLVQGYVVAPPMPPSLLVDWLEKREININIQKTHINFDI